MEELRQFYKFRPDEIFRRVTVSSLVGLMLEVSKLEYQVHLLDIENGLAFYVAVFFIIT